MTKYDDLAQTITNNMIERIQAADLAKSIGQLWTGGAFEHFSPANATTGDYYRGFNVLALYIAGTDNNYPTAQWATYRQFQSVDAQVRKAETGTHIVKWVPIKDKDAPNKDDQQKRLVPKVYTVHNVAQVDGYKTGTHEIADVDTLANVETFIANTGATTNRGSHSAFYRLDTDEINMPNAERFLSTQAHYAVWLHELGHWTGATHRLNREQSNDKTSPEYAREELVAELCSAMLCARLNITPEPRDDHAIYLKSWLKDLTNDPKALTTAAAKANQALQHLEALQPANQLEPSPA